MKVLVTGGAGFIGSHLSLELAKKHEVVVVDNLSAGSMSMRTLDSFTKSDIEFVAGDILDGETMRGLMRGVDTVYHLAALNSVARSLSIPMQVHVVNATGTLFVLLAARDAGVRRVVYASSSSVYGDLPFVRREDIACVPRSPYGASKLAGEAYCTACQHSFGLSTVSLRYFNVYGERQSRDSEYAAVVPRFITAIMDGGAPVIYGDGKQVRDFTFVDDVVRATVLAGASEVTGVFNIGSGEGHTINELLDILCGIIGKPIKSEYAPVRKGDVSFSIALIEKARQLGYSPRWDLKSGLERLAKNWER